MIRPIHKKYGDQFPIKLKAMPKWLIWVFGPMIDKALDRKYISKNVNHKFTADNSKGKTELRMDYRPLEGTMVESFDVLVDNKILLPRKVI